MKHNYESREPRCATAALSSAMSSGTSSLRRYSACKLIAVVLVRLSSAALDPSVFALADFLGPACFTLVPEIFCGSGAWNHVACPWGLSAALPPLVFNARVVVVRCCAQLRFAPHLPWPSRLVDC